MRKLLLFGIGKIGQIAHHHFATDSDYGIAAFVTDSAYVPAGGEFEGVPVVAFEEVEKKFSPQSHDMFVAIGYHGMNGLRAERYSAAKHKGYTLATYISSSNKHIKREQAGDNCFVMSGDPLQARSRIGNDTFVWTGALVGHHASVGDHCWITSGVTIGGNTRVGDYCFLGLGATIGHEITVGKSCLIGAGALVNKNAADNGVYIAAETPRFRLTTQQFLKMNRLQ